MSAGDLDVDPGRGDVHQHVRPGARAQLPGPARQPVGGDHRIGPGGVFGERLHPDHDRRVVGVDGVDQVREAGGGDRVVGAVHREDRMPPVERLVRVDMRGELRPQAVWHVEEVGAVAVATDEVLGLDLRAVGRLPR